ncbi:MAG: hypothetical protein KO202_08405 [Methanobacteriaceae archaeon]|jgi:hypothetical protein|nr:hypothetical protein [Methanobacteriaceae archaeon]
MFFKIRRDTLIILLLAFILILSGRLITYTAYASSPEVEHGIPISGIIVKGNDIVPMESIRVNVMQSGLRDGSFIDGEVLITSKKQLSLNKAINDAQELATRSTIPGTSITPITAADVQVDKETGIVTVTVIEDFSTVEYENTTASQYENSSASEYSNNSAAEYGNTMGG